MHAVVDHHRLDDKNVAVGVVDEVCITFFESAVVVLPLELLRRLLVHVVDIGEWPLLHLYLMYRSCALRISLAK